MAEREVQAARRNGHVENAAMDIAGNVVIRSIGIPTHHRIIKYWKTWLELKCIEF